MKKTLTREMLHELLHYNPDTGVFVWRVRPKSTRINVGDEAGGISNDGYLRIRINGFRHLAHRLAWLYVHGEFPPNFVDHINGSRQDNRLVNLREATRTENARNRARRRDNSSGFTGVSFDNKSKKWRAQCSLNGRRTRICGFSTPQEASEAYEQFIAAHWGDFKPGISRRINDRLAPVTLVDGGLAALGFAHATTDQFPQICAALVLHIQTAECDQSALRQQAA
jgi:hypothetical protein